MQKQTQWLFAILLLISVGHVSAADNKIVYLDRDGKPRSLNFVSCPAGEHVLVKDFKVTGTAPMPAFLIAQEELSAENYSHLVDLSKTDGSNRELPTLESLLRRVADVCYPSSKSRAKRDEFYRELSRAYRPHMTTEHSLSHFPVFGLTFDEAMHVCEVLQTASRSDDSTDVTVALPTRDQWQYACRGTTDFKTATLFLHFSAWPFSTDVRRLVAQDERMRRLFADLDELQDRLNASDFKGLDDGRPFDLSTPVEFVNLLQRYEAAEERTKSATADVGNLVEILNRQHLIVCSLREILRCSVPNVAKRHEMPLTLGMSTVERVVQGQTNSFMSPRLSPLGALLTLKHVDDAEVSVPSRWGLIHATGNVREWAREVVVGGSRPVVVDSGVFDFSPHWQHCLIWHADAVVERTVIDGNGVVLAGLRPIIHMNNVPQ